MADKLDTLTGFWAADEKPTGSKDPFALRRAALGVIRLMRENQLSLRLERFIEMQLVRHIAQLSKSLSQDDIAGGEAVQADGLPKVSKDLMGFFHDRLKVHLKDEGIRL